MADTELELLKVLITSTATLATVTAIIYSWVQHKTRPITWTLTGITCLLWSIALLLWSQRWVLTQPGVNVPDDVAITRSLFLIIATIGYALFLFGTYNSGPVRKKNAEKNAEKTLLDPLDEPLEELDASLTLVRKRRRK